MARLATFGLVAAMVGAPAGMGLAQDAGSQLGNPVVIPSAPPIMATPLSTQAPDQALPPLPLPPPGLVQTPMPPANADSGAAPVTADGTQAGQAPAATAVPATPPALPDSWVPGQTAGIGVLNKVDGSTAEVAIPVGGQSTSGDMRISVLACVSRPANQIPDAAVFVSIQTSDAAAGAPLYRGWMVRSTPGAAVVGDASAILRVVSCS